MTVQTQTSFFAYVGDGVTTVFPFPSKFMKNADLVVALKGVVQTSGYTVTGAKLVAGGSVTITPAPAAAVPVSILRNPTPDQLTSFVNSQTLLAPSVEDALDRITGVLQYLVRGFAKTFRLSSDYDNTVTSPIPIATDRAGKYLAFDAQGQPIVITSPSVLSYNPATALPGDIDFNGFKGLNVGKAVSPSGAARLDQLPEGATFATRADLLSKVWPAGAQEIYLRGQTTDGVGGAHYSRLAVAPGVVGAQHVVSSDGIYGVVSEPYLNLLQMGGRSDNTIDNAALITAALSLSAASIVIPSGTWRCDTMISVDVTQKIIMRAGATLKRVSAFSAVTDPVVWLKGYGCSLEGEGEYSCALQTENACPRGVARIGHKDMTQSHANCLLNSLSKVRLVGSVVSGLASDIGLYMPNPQLGGLASYFHRISDVSIWNVNWGLVMEGWANGNRLRGLTFVGVGTKDIHIKGAQENRFYDIFGHGGGGYAVDGLTLDSYDNTGVAGGVIHQPDGNTFQLIGFELGGVARGVVANAGINNFIQVYDNCAGGNFFAAGWFKNNEAKLTFDSANSPVKIGKAQIVSKTGTGTLSVTVSFTAPMTVAGYRNGILKFTFAGVTAGLAAEEYAEYAVPIVGEIPAGVPKWKIGVPTKLWGTALTIVQTAGDANSVTFTVAGSDAGQNVSVLLAGVGYNGMTIS